MSTSASPPPAPRPVRGWFTSDKEEVYIPGAGTLGMGLLLTALGTLFLASIVSYLVIRFVRFAGQPWPPPGFPAPPASLWLSTLVILSTSVTIHLAAAAVKHDRLAALGRYLVLTIALGALFLLLQVFNAWEFVASFPPGFDLAGPYLGLFFVLTGLHAAHVIGGLIPLAIVWTRRSRYSANFHPGVRYCAMYWHFLDVIWLILFSLICLL
jgi:cytochrome c oxidase subunit 3